MAVCATLLTLALFLIPAGNVSIPSADAAQTTPVPPGQLLLDTVIEDWPTDQRYVHLVVDVPGPGFVATETDGYRPDPECGERGELCWCAYGGGVRFFAFDSAGDQVAGFGTGDSSLDMWIDGGLVVADADVCLSSNIDPYPYKSFVKVYWDSDSDSDKVPDSRDACPGTPPGVEVTENGCPPGSVASATAQASPQGQARITIINNTQQTICYVHISPTESEDWGPDWLGADETLPPGSSKTVELPPGTYDMLAADCDSNEVDSQFAVAVSAPTTWVIGGGPSPVSVPRDGITGIQDAMNPAITGRGPYAQGATILFSGEAAGDSYLWDWGDGRDTGWLPIPASEVVQDQYAYDCPGTYVVAKMVQYSGGSDVPNQLYDEAEVEIYSTLASGGAFGWQPVTDQYPDSFDDYYVTFTAPEATGGLPPYNYYWDFGDDQVHMPDTAGNPIAHKFMEKGNYTVTLTVFDSCNTQLVDESQVIPVGSAPGTTTPSSPGGTGCAATPLLAMGGALTMVALARRNRL